MNQLKQPINADAILWDFDGTLANSAAKNIAISQQILAQVAPRLTGANLPPCLQSEAEYHIANHGADHWRELYHDFFGMTPAEIETAGPMWEIYQMQDNTAVTLFEGVADTVRQLSGRPQGICSANATRNIRQVLDEHGISQAFNSVIGYEDLSEDHQKPAPEGGLKCLEEIFGTTRGKTIVYVGDHIADVMFSRGLHEKLGPDNTVISIIVKYSGANPHNWRQQPDITIDSPSELVHLIN